MSRFISIFLGFSLLLASAGTVARAVDDDTDRDADLIAGKAALEDGFHAVAQKRFEAYLSAAFFQKSKARGSVLLAQSLLGQGKAQEAAKWLAEHWSWGQGTPSESGFAYWLARAQFELGQADDALRTLRDFDTKYAGDRLVPGALRLRAHASLKAARREKALENFAQFDQKFPADAQAPANLLDWAGVLMEDLRHGEAEQVLQKLVREHANSAAAATGSLWLGELLAERGADVQARMILGALLSQTNLPLDVASRGWLAVASIEERGSNFAAVASALQRGELAATNAAVQVEARLRRAQALRNVGKADEAAKLLEETVRLYPTQARSGESLLALGDMRAAAGLHQQALDYFQRYLESITDTNGQARALLGKANALLGLQRYPEAAEAYEKVAARQTSELQREAATIRAAQALFQSGSYAAAHALFQRVLRTLHDVKQQASLALQSAEALILLGDAEAAERELRSIQKDFAGQDVAEQAILRRGSMYEERGRWAEAEAAYAEFIAEYPRSLRRSDALLARANLRYRTGDFPAAVSDCDLLLKDAPATAAAEKAFFLRVRCIEMQGDATKARELGQQFLLKYPGSAWAADVQFWLGEQAFNRRDLAGAEKLFADLARDYPSNSLADDAFYWAGRAAAAADEHRRAVTHYNQVAKLFTNSPMIAEARFAQGDALSEIGEYAAAILAFEEVVRQAPGTPLADLARGRKGDCQFTLAADKPDRYREALASFRAVMDSPGAESDVKLQAEYKLARCFEKMNRRQDALEHYLNVVYRWQSLRTMGQYPDAVWFTRSAFAAAALKEEDKQSGEAIRIYERVVAAGLPAGEDARQRIEKLKAAAVGG